MHKCTVIYVHGQKEGNGPQRCLFFYYFFTKTTNPARVYGTNNCMQEQWGNRTNLWSVYGLYGMRRAAGTWYKHGYVYGCAGDRYNALDAALCTLVGWQPKVFITLHSLTPVHV